MILTLHVPAANDRGPQFVEHVLKVAHQANRAATSFSLEYGWHDDRVLLFARVPDRNTPLLDALRSQLYAQYPDARIDTLPDDALEPSPTDRIHTSALVLVPDIISLQDRKVFDDIIERISTDPVASLFHALHPVRSEDLRCRVTLTLRPCSRLRVLLQRLRYQFYWLTQRIVYFGLDRPVEDADVMKQKLSALLFEARLTMRIAGANVTRRRAKTKFEELAGVFGAFVTSRHVGFRLRRRPQSFLLTATETAGLWHPPSHMVQEPNHPAVASRHRPPPINLPTNREHPHVPVLGVTAFRTTWKKFGVLPDDRRRHSFFIGRTGVGKSTLMFRQCASDINAGNGIGIIDPHGDLIDDVLSVIPRSRRDDVVLFHPADTAHPPGMNILDCATDAFERSLVASGVVSIFKRLFGFDEATAPRLLHILRNSLLALLEYNGSINPERSDRATLISLQRILHDHCYRKTVLEHVHNPAVRSFWENEFATWQPKDRTFFIASLQNKLGAFVTNETICHIVGQPENRIDLRHAMDAGKIVLANLSKGKLGDDVSAFLGTLLVIKFQLAAMSRADQEEDDRRDFFLYVDEFQNFASESFATILSEARKYGLILTLANQYLGQLDRPETAQVLRSIFGNVGNIVSFQLGEEDAQVFARQFSRDPRPEEITKVQQDLMNLPKYQAYARILIDGEPTPPFSMKTLKLGTRRAKPDAIVNLSRHRYARRSVNVKREIQEAFTGA